MKTIQNPILRGFCPDPCMIRTGQETYTDFGRKFQFCHRLHFIKRLVYIHISFCEFENAGFDA